jgi:hypothetical protein
MTTAQALEVTTGEEAMEAGLIERGAGGLDAGRRGEIEDGQGGGGERNAISGPEVGAVERRKPVEADAGAWAPAPTRRDADQRTMIQSQSPEAGCSQMGEGRGRPRPTSPQPGGSDSSSGDLCPTLWMPRWTRWSVPRLTRRWIAVSLSPSAFSCRLVIRPCCNAAILAIP